MNKLTNMHTYYCTVYINIFQHYHHNYSRGWKVCNKFDFRIPCDHRINHDNVMEQIILTSQYCASLSCIIRQCLYQGSIIILQFIYGLNNYGFQKYGVTADFNTPYYTIYVITLLLETQANQSALNGNREPRGMYTVHGFKTV